MAALIEACDIALSVENTGAECDSAMGPTAMLIAVPPRKRFTRSDLTTDFYAALDVARHAQKGDRILPLFGNRLPIVNITDSNEADVVETYANGQTSFVRFGSVNRIFETPKGGLCWSEKLIALAKLGYTFIEVDNQGQVVLKRYADDTFGGLNCIFNPSSPALATFTTGYKNRVGLSFNPAEYVNNGKIFAGGQDLLDLEGLLDLIVVSKAAATATTATVGAKTECGGTDLSSFFTTELAAPSAWVVTKVVAGVVTNVAVTGVAYNATLKAWVLTFGTQATGTVLTINVSPADVLYGLNVEGFEGSVPVIVTVP